jgi:hypothetical protein
MNSFKPGDLVYRLSHLEWGKLKVVSSSHIKVNGSELSSQFVRVKLLSTDEIKLIFGPALIPAEVYESELYKALNEKT